MSSPDWKEAARHFWRRANGCHQEEAYLKRCLRNEREKRRALRCAMGLILTAMAYDEDDEDRAYCQVCHRHLLEEDGHSDACLYLLGMATLFDAR